MLCFFLHYQHFFKSLYCFEGKITFHATVAVFFNVTRMQSWIEKLFKKCKIYPHEKQLENKMHLDDDEGHKFVVNCSESFFLNFRHVQIISSEKFYHLWTRVNERNIIISLIIMYYDEWRKKVIELWWEFKLNHSSRSHSRG